jgi:hypothetical protein
MIRPPVDAWTIVLMLSMTAIWLGLGSGFAYLIVRSRS